MKYFKKTIMTKTNSNGSQGETNASMILAAAAAAAAAALNNTNVVGNSTAPTLRPQVEPELVKLLYDEKRLFPKHPNDTSEKVNNWFLQRGKIPYLYDHVTNQSDPSAYHWTMPSPNSFQDSFNDYNFPVVNYPILPYFLKSKKPRVFIIIYF
ncbi:hypothetical protein RFI_21016 [Reticulomyxa filosa]|uniref:Uncharacterized protein n=1 Tax=Reticulomyxa filosa TaxID=46433 RepID=X6MRQ4_RETFI|nr:hypothetical protein RFI_21016 [Reticulomyxa filosa]|eukprot:ETO16336.1 hypothetical protein RFI_21016 [Reticulomyxa filosa]